ncbi:hypothetical protein [Acinetobacter beijerinckii]|uniref:Uncharacterized protein n=1 Tax=Acinetobacter beijerinckii ANC 3835 TaxID=1217649 RepID=N9FEN3_9GAMM|nr:hypothetical protein [Acinetobacter beijerinckii]ENW05745.1 hypothetical protein F934_01102 [Acinetobacter beijerinckii ANC 3835]
MSIKVREILSLSDDQVKQHFAEHCEKMGQEGLLDIKFCIKGYDSVEEIQRQFLAIEQMQLEGLTNKASDFELFNTEYSA